MKEGRRPKETEAGKKTARKQKKEKVKKEGGGERNESGEKETE